MADDVKKQGCMPSYYPPCATEPLDVMYPDIYYQVYPVVKQYCEMYDNPSNPGCYPYPTRMTIEQMTTQIYQKVVVVTGYQLERQDGRGLLRSLVLILLIRELLRRRGSY
ncbi:hypothetical protein SAMN05660649_01042 [Desulfotomaculum arcticum]|uniref:Uncharacterized protein n=1 Tax=Desulfotruncus arcticus DSM 17038 TaxID=1121424 RepID=A0A1I2Q4J3_9FIRM|nr:hypothetical protein [Desulfotruncus arcticus]SFG22850.1 hypothetical protein SAMN05660649_01042 [Desulfotomaculum arcticum] [Desulfotruncus arcticus DSM 17038]